MSRRLFLTQAGTWLLPAACPALPAAAEQPLARIGLATDIHFADKPAAGAREYRASLSKLGEAVEIWNREKVDAAIELGDFVDSSPTAAQETADLRRILEVLGGLRAPRYFALGNHCVFTLTKKQFLEAWGAGQSWYSFSLNGYRGIVLDSAFSSDGRPYGGREFDWQDALLPPAQVEWLEAELRRSTLPSLVFLHHRLDSGDHYSVRNAAAVRKVLEASGRVAAVLQGHNHLNDYRRIGGIHYCTLKAMVDGPPPESSAYGTLELYAGSRMFLKGFRLLGSREMKAGPD